MAALVAAFAVPTWASGDRAGGAQPDGMAAPLAAPGAGPMAGTAAAAQDAAARPEVTVTLLTGERVRVDALGAEITGATSGSGSSTFLEFGSYGNHYVVPAAAMPYLGITLDVELFNVSALARLEEDPDSPTLAVTIEQSQPGSAEELPAVEVSGVSGTTATAAIAKAQAHELGQLLAEQFEASSTGSSSTPAGELPGISRISLAETPAAGGPAAMPQAGPPADRPLRYHTLTLKFIGYDGGPPALFTPGTVGFVQNLDDHRLSPGLQLIPAGQEELRLSVPEGTYSTMFGITRPARPGLLDGALVSEPEFTVDSDRTITLDARTAVPYQVELDESIALPQVRRDRLHFTRTIAPGESFGSDSAPEVAFMGIGSISTPGAEGSTLAATPTSSPVTRGGFGFRGTTTFSSSVGTSEHDPETESTYLLDFPHAEGVPESLSYTVEESELTTVHSEIHRAPVSEYRWENPILETDFVFHTDGMALAAGFNKYVPAGERTDYWYSAAPELTTWQQEVSDPEPHYGLGRGTVGPPRRIRPGEQIHQVWNKGPEVPSPAALTGLNTSSRAEALDVWSMWCVACRQDDNGALFLLPNGDSDPSHAGTYNNHYGLGGVVSHLDFYRDGELALSGDANGSLGGYLNPTDFYLPLLPTPASYRLDWTLSDKVDPASYTATRWTFDSGRDDPAADLPDGMMCAPDTSRSCSFLPLLFVTYDLALDYLSRAPADAPFELAFTVGHQQGQAPPLGVSATVAVSYDDGETWTEPRAATAGPDGTFTTTVQHPPPADSNGYVALRVHATDAAGNTVDQTITRAYALTD